MNPDLQLRDIHIPPPPHWWPPAPGWWLVALLLILVAAGLAVYWQHRRRRQQRCARILAELDQLPTQMQGPTLVAAISALLKRVALQHYSRAEVAALTGEAWLAFLDRTGGNGRLRHGAEQLLTAYAPRLEPHADVSALVEYARLWIRSQRSCR